jgi:hypothetical protein
MLLYIEKLMGNFLKVHGRMSKHSPTYIILLNLDYSNLEGFYKIHTTHCPFIPAQLYNLKIINKRTQLNITAFKKNLNDLF